MKLTLYYIWRRVISGSLGAEIWSSFAWVALAIAWFVIGPPPPFVNGWLLTLSTTWAHTFIVGWIVIGTIHAITLCFNNTPSAVFYRKIAASLELIAWMSVLLKANTLSAFLVFVPLIFLLFVSILRRRYFDLRTTYDGTVH